MQSYRQELYKQYITRAYLPGQLRLRFMQVPADYSMEAKKNTEEGKED